MSKIVVIKTGTYRLIRNGIPTDFVFDLDQDETLTLKEEEF